MNVFLIFITVPLVSLVISGIVLAMGAHTLSARWEPGIGSVCAQCWYDLKGLQSEICPECGADLSGFGTLTREKVLSVKWRFVTRARGYMTICFCGGGLVCASIGALGAYPGLVVASILAIIIGALCPILILRELWRFQRLRGLD